MRHPRFGPIRRLGTAFTIVALIAGTLLAPTAPARAEGADVEKARAKVREGDASAALRLLNDALKKDPRNADAHLLYQDAAVIVFGQQSVRDDYDKRLAESPDDALFAFLRARLEPPDKAVRAFDKLARQHKDSPWPLAGKGRALELQGKYAEALKAFDKAVAVAPEQPRFRAYQAYVLERMGKWAGALEAWAAVVKLAPEDRGARLGLGEAMRREGDLTGALEQFELVAKKYPRDSEPKYRVALVEMDSGKYAEAIKRLKFVLQQDKEMVPAMCGIAEASLLMASAKSKKARKLLTEEDLKEARSFAERAVVTDPEDPAAHFIKGAVREAMGEFDADHLEKALESYQESLDLIPFPGPEKLRALIAKAFVYLRLGKWDDAIRTGDMAIDMDKKAIVAYTHAGHAMVRMDRSDEALKKYYKPALALDPENAALHHGRGTALWDMGSGKYNDALKALKKAVALEKDNGLYRRSLGDLYYDMNKFKDAVKELYEATDLRPWDDVAWASYGRACCQRKHWDDAIEAYEKALELKDDYVKAHFYLAILYFEKKKEYEKAKEHVMAFTEKDGKADATMESFIKRVLEK